MENREESSDKKEQLIEAHNLKKEQDKVRNKFSFLKDIPSQYFQSAYVKAQAEEICRYVRDIQISPLNPWYTALYNLISEGKFMSQFYLTFNEFDVIVPDYKKIETLILKDPDPDDFPRIIHLG